MDETPAGERIGQILDRLGGEYGVPRWQPGDDPVSVLVGTILSQNTSDTNSIGAFRSLLTAFGSWEKVAAADVDEIIGCIRRGGLGRIKAQRIKQALGEIVHRQGRLELDFLGRLPLSEAEEWLQRLPGVGMKTARCVLLFSLAMPALPVDTHILRVARRLGLLSPTASLPEAHYVLGRLVPLEEVYQFHILLIKHGRTTCRARHPACQGCVLKGICRHYNM